MKKLTLISLLLLLSIGIVIAKERFTIVNLILDESGSMEQCKKDTIESVKNYFEKVVCEHKDVYFRLVQFNSNKVETTYESSYKCPFFSCFKYEPDGWTPLYDAIGETIKQTEEKRKTKKCKCCSKESRTPVLCVIVTDGLENASKKYDKNDIISMIEEKKKDDWTFIYLGANQDAWAEGTSISIVPGNIIQWDYQDIKLHMNNVTDCSNEFLNSGSISTDSFFENKK